MDGPYLTSTRTPLLDAVDTPDDLKRFDDAALARLSDEVRQELIEVIATTGGHLGSGLGVVELTVALHAVFDAPRDKIIWDVSHQCYPHKMLTGRRERMGSIRQGGGISGFTRRAESAYDPFGAAHSSTAMSAGFGFATARDLAGESGEVICVVGDGAMSAGMAYEAMNNIGASGTRMLIVLNDNGMSIAPPVGAFAAYLERIHLPPADDVARADTMFEDLGLAYRGPVDGHDVDALLQALRWFRDAEESGPVLLHVRTRKGAGYPPAEASADKYHGVGKFDPASGAHQKSTPKAPAYTKVFGTALLAEAERDDRIIAITAAMPSGAGVDAFGDRFPDRFFDVGIAEQHAVTFAAGLAASGMRPFCAIYSTFLQRGYDQIVHDVALQGLPVRFAIDRAGLVGADGATHAGSFDVAYLASLPNMTVMAAADEADLVHMVATAVRHDAGPIAFRYPRGEGVGAPLPQEGAPLPLGVGRILRRGRDIALLSFGGRLCACLDAAEALGRRGFSTTVADARFCKPLDEDLIRRLAVSHDVLITVEEGSVGGFAAHVFQFVAAEGLLDGSLQVRAMTLPDRFIDQASPDAMYADAGLAAADIMAAALNAITSEPMRGSAVRGKVTLADVGAGYAD